MGNIMDIPFEDPENIEDPAIREILGEYKKAVEAKDFVGQGESLLHLGTLYAIREQFATAIKYYNQALEIQEDCGDEQGQSKALSNIGLAKADLGNFQDAIKYHLKALTISRRTNNRVAETNHLINLAETYEYLKQYNKALDCLEEVQTLYQTMNVPHLLRKAKLNWDRLKTLQKEKQNIENNKRSTATHRLITGQLQLEANTNDDKPANELSEKAKTKASNLTTVHRLPNEALKTIQSIQRATNEMKESQKIQNEDEEPEADITSDIPELDDEILFGESEEGEFGVDTEPAEAPAELNIANSEDTSEFTPHDPDTEERAALMDNPKLSSNVRLNFVRQAIKDIQYEMSIAEAISDQAKKGDLLMRLAALYLKLHQYDNAINHYEQAIVLFGVLGKNYFREEAERGILEAREQKWS